jgi:hypothetical protein
MRFFDDIVIYSVINGIINVGGWYQNIDEELLMPQRL